MFIRTLIKTLFAKSFRALRASALSNPFPQCRQANSGPSPFAGLLLATLFLLQACSGGSGGGASDRDVDTGGGNDGGGFVYSGPAPASEETQSFKIEFYDNLVLQDRCGSCHTGDGPGPTAFVDNGDVNLAWREALTVVDLDNPSASAVVTRVANGHNCWLGAGQEATCGTTVTGYIERWAQGAQTSTAEIQLTPTDAFSPEATLVFPPTGAIDFSNPPAELVSNSPPGLLYLLNIHCSDCHSDTAQLQQSPFFASDDPEIAYEAVRSKVDLNNPVNSRVVQRLANDSHNCWTTNCASDAADMQSAVERYAATLSATEVDPDLVISMAQILDQNGIVASTGGRYETDIIAKWEFREGTGTTVADTSGVQPEAPLTLQGDYTWFGGWGINFVNARAQAAVSGSVKLMDRITGTGEYSIEAWVAPNNVSQEDAWIVSYAGGPMSRNLLVTQNLYDYELFNRSSANENEPGAGAGAPALSTDDDAEFAQATLQHVVLTFDPVNGRRIYVNGEFTGDIDSAGGGTLNNWNQSFAVILGNDPGMQNPWAGVMRMIAIHNRRLSDEQIVQNYDVGVGEKFFLLFSVSEILDREGECHTGSGDDRVNLCYIAFEVSQFDGTSYLFNAPFFISLSDSFNPDGIVLQGIRIGINGKLAEVGQGFANVNTTINATDYGAVGQPLSDIGSVIALENGSDQDMFFLSFANIDGNLDATTPTATANFSYSLSGALSADVGFRTFDEINASFAAITGVATTQPNVAATQANVRQSLPVTADFQAYLSSHQTAATQLAIAYCDALVDNNALRDAFFPGAASTIFGANASNISNANWSNLIIYPLVDKTLATGLSSQPDRTAVHNELLTLITDSADNRPYDQSPPYAPLGDGIPDGLARCGGSCPAGRTDEVVKAVCGALLGSSAVIMQ